MHFATQANTLGYHPSKWMGGSSDRDNYDDGPHGGPGYGYGGPSGYGGPGYGYGGPGGYGAPGYGYSGPGVCGTPTGYGSPPAGAGEQSEVNALRERIRVLEAAGTR